MHVKICLLYNTDGPCFYFFLSFFKARLKFTALLTNAFIIFGFKAFGWVRNRILPRAYETHGVEQGSEAEDTLSSLHVSSYTTYVLFSTPSLFLPMHWFSYADLYNLVTWCHIKLSVGALSQ
jgi:hypothetical protein